MIEQLMEQILQELGDGTYILVSKIRKDGGVSTISKWRNTNESSVIGLLEKTKHDLLTEINKRQMMVKDDGTK